MAQKQNSRSHKNNLEMMIVWFSGTPSDGKSTAAGLFAKNSNTPLIDTDEFVRDVLSNCSNDTISRLAKAAGTAHIGARLDEISRDATNVAYVAKQLANHVMTAFHGQPLGIIEGYMPVNIQDETIDTLKANHVRVWIAMNQRQFEFIRRARNWR